MIKMELVAHVTPPGTLPQQAQTSVEVQDGGAALIAEFASQDDAGMFVRIQSWDPSCKHVQFAQLVNRTVKITIEIVEPF
jgi:uncharacterized membrane-anchored protein